MDPFKPFSVADIGLSPGTVISVTAFEDGSKLDVTCTSEKAVGSGASGYVILGELPGRDRPSPLALKVFRSVLDPTAMELLRRELAIVKRLGSRHPHILPFIGEGLHNGTNAILISPYMENGNLMEYLKSRSPPRLPLMLQVADAVRYLHDDCKLVHGDLKCENILVSDDGRALLADFGLSTFVENTGSDITTRSIRRFCSIRFAAPEILTDTAVSSSGQVRSKTTKSDVYAFGMLVLQAFSNRRPWMDLDRSQIISNVLRGTIHPHPGFSAVERGFDNSCWETCRSCWKTNPVERPTMAQAIQMLPVFVSSSEASVSAGEERPAAPPGPVRHITLDDAHPILPSLVPSIHSDTAIHAYTKQGGHRFPVVHLEWIARGSDAAAVYEGDAILLSGTKLRVTIKFSALRTDKWESGKNIQWRELQIAQQVQHQRLLPMFAAARHDMWLGLISPCMKNGNMFDYLKARPSLDCRPLILQVADAIEHLHVHESIVHGDIKGQNVLISDDGDALLSDFSSSTFTTAPEETTATFIRGRSSAAFGAPEHYLGHDLEHERSKTIHTDIYAFGMTILQALTRRHPWHPASGIKIIFNVTAGKIPNRPQRGETAQELSDSWWDVCVECWSRDPLSRPSIQEVRRRLSAYSDALEEFDALF